MASKNLHTILGSTGNIGTALAKELAAYTSNIRLVSRNPQKVNNSDILFKADLLKEEEVKAAVKDSAVVYLVVGITYKTKMWEEQWPIIMKNVLNSCKAEKAKLLFFDNMYCYDPNHVGHLTENSPVNPSSRKGKVRAEIASMLLKEIKEKQITGMIVRAADFYGPNAKLSFLHESVINRMKAGKTAQWLYDKNKKHTFTYIPDAAYATAFLGQNESAWNQVWHLPTSKTYPSGQEVVNILAKHLGVPNNMAVLPGFMVWILGLFIPILKEVKELRYQLDKDYCFDSSKIEQAFELKATPIKEGLIKCI
ncbi:NAD-dependent epimerase/dehydratase family protein [Cecembia calidifontis]|jgi:nucleoside-diphosphate-sugar epimerase|uniref:Nucleoside-diphosphate-sugar epimerase n=1 Tax=Cecembia calidifontis TaxID=1187080 RepID=A0A4Q7PBD3_9BACT|nr:NAD-dependent epimerase/dehydratase family protein [Cecembia calidifontis]RZS97297.1 nucleoside-diphosphate-sugar epimerase [Cecembia calidifontis]